MDALLKKYAEMIIGEVAASLVNRGYMKNIELLLLKFLIEYIELREGKKKDG